MRSCHTTCGIDTIKRDVGKRRRLYRGQMAFPYIQPQRVARRRILEAAAAVGHAVVGGRRLRLRGQAAGSLVHTQDAVHVKVSRRELPASQRQWLAAAIRIRRRTGDGEAVAGCPARADQIAHQGAQQIQLYMSLLVPVRLQQHATLLLEHLAVMP
jgi:hypothetical protein